MSLQFFQLQWCMLDLPISLIHFKIQSLSVVLPTERVVWRCFTTEPGEPCVMMNGTWMTHRFFVGAWGTGMLRALPRGAAMDKDLETSLSIMFSAVGMNRVSLTVPTMDSKYITAIILRTQGLVVQVYEYIPYFPKLNMIISKFLWGLIHFVGEYNFICTLRTYVFMHITYSAHAFWG